MRRSRFATDFSVGFVLFVATALVIGGLLFIESGWQMFGDRVEYRVLMPSAVGLRSGTKVYLSGIDVGAVKHISLPADMSVTRVEVELRIDHRFQERIRDDSFAWLQSEGLLGDTSIHLRAGSAGAAAVPPGGLIPYKDRPLVEELVGEQISSGTASLLQETLEVLETINEGEGTLGRLVNNSELYDNLNKLTVSLDEATKQLTSLSKEVGDVIVEVKAQRGTLGKLVFSEEYARDFGEALRNVGTILANVRDLSEGVREGKGSAGKLFASSELHDATSKALEDVARATGRLDRLLSESEASRGLIARLFADGRMAEDLTSLFARLDRSATSLEAILGKIERGDGSVGMMVHDPSVAASIRDLFLGVKESGLVQAIVRSAERAGREKLLGGLDPSEREAREAERARILAAFGKRSPGGEEEPDVVRPGAEAGAAPVPAVVPREPEGTPGGVPQDSTGEDVEPPRS